MQYMTIQANLSATNGDEVFRMAFSVNIVKNMKLHFEIFFLTLMVGQKTLSH